MNGLFMTVEGVVGTEPRRGAWNGTPVLSFRMVAKERRYDSLTQGWVDVHSSWVSVSCFRALARNVAESIQKGDRLIVHGKVKVKDYVTEGGDRRTTVDIEATSVGHDLKFGTARFRPAVAVENVDDRLREQAEAYSRELAEEPQENVAALLAQRAALAAAEPDPDLDDLDDLDEEEDLDEEADLDDEGEEDDLDDLQGEDGGDGTIEGKGLPVLSGAGR